MTTFEAAETQEVAENGNGSKVASGEEMSLRAVADRLRNISTPATLNQDFRQEGGRAIRSADDDLTELLESLKDLTDTIEAAAKRASTGSPLPLIEEAGFRIVDLKYTKYTKD